MTIRKWELNTKKYDSNNFIPKHKTFNPDNNYYDINHSSINYSSDQNTSWSRTSQNSNRRYNFFPEPQNYPVFGQNRMMSLSGGDSYSSNFSFIRPVIGESYRDTNVLVRSDIREMDAHSGSRYVSSISLELHMEDID